MASVKKWSRPENGNVNSSAKTILTAAQFGKDAGVLFRVICLKGFSDARQAGSQVGIGVTFEIQRGGKGGLSPGPTLADRFQSGQNRRIIRVYRSRKAQVVQRVLMSAIDQGFRWQFIQLVQGVQVLEIR